MLEGEGFVVGEEDGASCGSLHLFEYTAVVGVEDACKHLTFLDVRPCPNHAIEDTGTTGGYIHQFLLVEHY